MNASDDGDPLSESALFEFYRQYIDRYSSLFKSKYTRDNGEQFVCTLCAECCPQEEDMVFHLLTHTGEKPFVCDTCLRGFDEQQELNAHVVQGHSTPSKKTRTALTSKKTNSGHDLAEYQPQIKQEYSSEPTVPETACIVSYHHLRPEAVEIRSAEKQKHILGQRNADTQGNKYSKRPVGKIRKPKEFVDGTNYGSQGDPPPDEVSANSLVPQLDLSDVKQELLDSETGDDICDEEHIKMSRAVTTDTPSKARGEARMGGKPASNGKVPKPRRDASVGRKHKRNPVVCGTIKVPRKPRQVGRTFIKCAHCPYETFNKSVMTRHLRTHTGDKPFACSECAHRCALQSQLNAHMRTHTGEKPFACTECDYSARVKTTLTRHMHKHTGERPFRCIKCTFASSRQDNLAVHLRIRHQLK